MQLLLPQDCLLCAADSSNELLCTECRNDLPYLNSDLCPSCALPVLAGRLCGQCLKHPPAFDSTTAVFSYTFPVDRLILDLKYRPNLAIAALLAELMLSHLKKEVDADFLLPLPLSNNRLRERGFNQAMEICRYLSRQTGIPILQNGYSKIKETSTQASLSWKDRAKNMRNAFECTIDLSAKKIIVIDDVMTTGASLEEFAKALRKQGATHISNWVVARTLVA